jgi:dolichyl-phosphate beta-glucosyltransferase
MEKESISVIVPCYNEGKTIYQNLKKIHSYLAPRFETFEIIAVNDGSADVTVNEIKRAQKEIPIRLIDNSVNEGKGKVIKDGMLAAKNDIMMFLDADLGISIEELEKFIVEIENGYDIVIASRFVPGLKIRRPVLWYRKIMERIFRWMRMVIINQWTIKDTQCGFKVFKREVAVNIFSRMTVKRFAFDAEVIYIAKKFHYKIKELPIALQNPPNSHVRLFLDPVNMTLDLLRIRMNACRRIYKIPNLNIKK